VSVVFQLFQDVEIEKERNKNIVGTSIAVESSVSFHYYFWKETRIETWHRYHSSFH